jgi:PTS system nitrogen regulatory IIA component
VVARLPLPPDYDREFLMTVLEAREAMGSTGIGDGIAIPHARNPILLHVDQPLVALCLLRHPVEFEAVDDLPVHALFVVISPSVPVHLKILARLGLVLRDAELRRMLKTRASTDDIRRRVQELESRPTGYFQIPK